MENLKRIRDLRMYIPFIDYATSFDQERFSKLICMKEWILENRMFSVEVLEKFKQSLIVQYHKLLLEDLKIPKNIMAIFNNGPIDLCSDDENTDTPSSSSKKIEEKSIESSNKVDLSDGEIVDSDTDTISTGVKKPISFQISQEQIRVKDNVECKNSTKNFDNVTIVLENKESKKHKKHKKPNDLNIRKEFVNTPLKEKCAPNVDKQEVSVDKEDEETEALLKRIDNLCGKTENKNNSSIECMSISDNSADEIAFELLKSKLQSADTTKNENKSKQIKNEQIFTRRSYKIENSPIKFDDYDFKTKIKKLKKKRSSNTAKNLPSDISSDEDFVPVAVPKPVPQNRTEETKKVTVVTLSDSDELNEKGRDKDIGECKTENSLLSNTCDKKLEKMDINELSSMFSELAKGNNIDLEHYLAEIAQTDNDLSSPTTSPYYAADNININKKVQPCAPTQFCFPQENFYSTNHIQAFTPQFPQMPQYSIMQQAPLQPPFLQPLAEPKKFPIIELHGKKINLNDPRVKKHLLSLQKSPDRGSAEQILPNSRCQDRSNRTLPNNNYSKSSPINYGEYKRRQAEKALELERCKQAKKRAEEQAILQKASNQKRMQLADLNSVQPDYLLLKSNNINDCPQIKKGVEAIRYNNTKKTNLDETKKVYTTKQLDKKPQPDKSRKSPLLETVETPTENSSINDSNATKITPKKNSKTNTKLSSTLRILKELECTFKGFDKLEDYLPQSSSGKRKSSESARSAIAKQLNGQQFPSESTTPEVRNNKKSGISVRRSSMGHALEQKNISHDAPAPIAKRRKTCTEVNLATLLQDSSTDSADESPTLRQHFTVPVKAVRIESSSSSSSDTDTFDFDEFNYKKTKAVALKNQPFVLLQRLTEAEIDKHLSRRRPVPPQQMCLNVKLVEKTTQKASEYSKPSAVAATKTKPCKNVPNIDVRMTERNSAYCALCKAKPVNLVNHYIRTHKTEPYVSRLTSKELEDLQLNCPFAVIASPSNARVLKYKVQCLFCAEELIDSFINFYTHYSAHTGEYAFQCYNCELKKPYRADIQSHKNHSKSCRNAPIQKLYVYPTNLMVIYLHCCKLCNFVQLNEANVFKHLREQHAKRTDDAIYIQKYIAAAINDAEIVNELLPEEETEFLAREASFEIHQESDSEFNCSEVDIKVDLSAYSSVLDDNNTQSTLSTPMTTIPISNVKTTFTSSFLDVVPEDKEEEKKETEVILPRPIIVKSELNVESDGYNCQSPPNCDAAHLHYRAYPQDIPYFGVFKCMATDCFFSTNADGEMLQHLNNHGSSECPPTGWLECSYCQLRSEACSKAEDLIAHIQLKHCHTRFQCSLCCYRSCVPGSVAMHSSIVHNSELDTLFMYECEGEIQAERERMPQMMASMLENVKKLQCGHCSLGFYAISALREHLNKIHGILAEDPAYLLEYSCIYCVMDLKQKRDIQKHIALKHPDELAYACKRVLKNPLLVSDDVYNLQHENMTDIVPLTAIRKPLTTTTLEQSSCSTSTLEHKTNTANLSEKCFPNQELNATDALIESVVPELLEEQLDLKPSLEQLEFIAMETVRAILNKLTSKTGLSPDRLYHCSVATCGGFFSTHALWSRHMTLRHNCLITRCPHCPRQLELTLSDFNQHFEEHCRHLYVCFHCSETFVNEQSTIAHFQNVHCNFPNFRFEFIKYNVIHSYRIIMNEDAPSERLELYRTLHDNVVKRLEQLVNEESSKMLSQWLVPASADWLDDYPTPNRNEKTCIVKTCKYKTKNVEELFQHCEASHTITGDFLCSRCSVQIKNVCSWEQIVEHVSMHNSSYVCSVCNYHHIERQQMSKHIFLEHNSRDAPFVSLFHSSEHTYVGVGVIFAASCKTFSTANSCFFCDAKNLSVETLAKHFKQVHNISMQHFCEICSLKFKNLSEVDAHHSSLHAGHQMKIRCQFVSHLQLFIRSTFPLSIDIMSADSMSKTRRSKQLQLSDCTEKAETIHHNKTPCVDGSVENLTTDHVRIKREIPDDDGNDSDSDVEIIEEDDLVRAEEFEARRNEQNEKIREPPRLKVRNIFETNATSNTPIAVISSTAANVHAPIKVTRISLHPNQSNILKLPTTTNTTAVKQTPTEVTKTAGTYKDSANYQLLQQVLYNNTTSSMQQSAQKLKNPVQQIQQPAKEIQPNNFSSSQHQIQQTQQLCYPQQTVGCIPHHNLASVVQQMRSNELPSTSNQSSSQQQIQQTKQTMQPPQQKVVNHQQYNSDSVAQQIRSNEYSSLSNQNSPQTQVQQNKQTIHTQQTVLKQYNLGSVTPQIRSNELPSTANQSSSQQQIPQTMHLQQKVVNHQQHNLGSVGIQIRSNEFPSTSNRSSSQQMQQPQHNIVSVYKTTMQTVNPQQPDNNIQKQHLSSALQQLPSNGQQQTQFQIIPILNPKPQTSNPQQIIIQNQQQHLGAVPLQIRPIGQVQQLKQTYNNSSTVQTTPNTISVRLSAPANTNQRIGNPSMQHLSQQAPQISVRHIQPSAGQFAPVGHNWTPPPSLEVTYVPTKTWWP